MLFIGESPLGRVSISSFSKRDIQLFLNRIHLLKPDIKFNEMATNLAEGSDSSMKKEINNVYMNSLYVTLFSAMAVLAVIGIFYLLR